MKRSYSKELDYSKLIIELRVQMNVSQEELSRILDVSVISISRWENGRTVPTKLDKAKLNKLFKEYNVELEKVEEFLWKKL